MSRIGMKINSTPVSHKNVTNLEAKCLRLATTLDQITLQNVELSEFKLAKGNEWNNVNPFQRTITINKKLSILWKRQISPFDQTSGEGRRYVTIG